MWDVAGLLKPRKGSGTPEVPRKEMRLKSLRTAGAHDKDINGVALSPNDALICTASQDRTAKVRGTVRASAQGRLVRVWLIAPER